MWLLYKIQFSNGKLYFGITGGTLKGRRGEHLRSAKRGSSLPVHNAIRKHDARFIPLVVGHRDYICECEIAAIKEYQTQDRRFGYNVSDGGDLSPMLRPETRAKVSEWNKLHPTLQTQAGWKHSGETRAKMSASQKERAPASDETRAKMSAVRKGRPKPWQVSGWREPPSNETRAKISIAACKRAARKRFANALCSALDYSYGQR